MIDNIQITDKCYHRNGITGLGFYAVSGSVVIDDVKEKFVATVSGPELEAFRRGQRVVNPDTRVLILTADGSVNPWYTVRGDHFHEPLCRLMEV